MGKWEMVRLGDVAHIAAGQGAPQGMNQYCEAGIPFIKAGNLGDLLNDTPENSMQMVNDSVARSYKLKLFPKDTILFAKSGMSCLKGYVYKLQDSCYVVNHLACIVVFGAFPGFLVYYLRKNSPSKLIKDEAYPSISLKDIAEIQIPLPPLPIQQKIADILDRASVLIEKRKAQIEKLDLLVKSQFIEMFGDPVTNPMGWEIYKLGNLCTLITKGASPNWQGYSYTNDSSQTLFVTSENVREGYLDLSQSKFIEDGFNEKQKRSLLYNGDFLINIVGASIGRAAQYYLSRKANINQAVALVRLKKDAVNDKYLLLYLNLPKALMMYERMQVSVARANLSLQNIFDLEILCPPLPLQNQFADFVQCVEVQKSLLQQSLVKLELNYNSLMQKCFSGEIF